MSIAVVETDELLERIRLVIREEVGASGMAHEEPEGWLNTEAAAKYLGVSQETIRSAVRGHGIPVTLTFSLVDVTTDTLLDTARPPSATVTHTRTRRRQAAG